MPPRGGNERLANLYRTKASRDFGKTFSEMRSKGWSTADISRMLGISEAEGRKFVETGEYPGEFAKSTDTGDSTTPSGGTGYDQPKSSVDYPATGTDTQDTITTNVDNQFLDAFNLTDVDRSALDSDPEQAAVDLQFQSLEQALLGRKAGVEELRQFEKQFSEDPLMAALEGKISGLADEPLISEDDLAGMLSGYDARLSQSYGNQANALATQFGQRGGMGAGDSGVQAELQNALRFNTLQQGAANEQQMRLGMKQMNRRALEDALRLGLGFQGFKQGTGAQVSGNIANLLAGESLTQNFSNTGSALAALAAPSSAGGMNPLLGGLLGAAGTAIGGPIGGALGSALGGIFGDED